MHDDPYHTDYVMNVQSEEDDIDYPFHVPYLTSIPRSLLSTIFSCQNIPARPASMQNRIEPLTGVHSSMSLLIMYRGL